MSEEHYPYELGKIHKWWLMDFHRSRSDGMMVSGYGGTAYGNALAGLLTKKYIKYVTGFGGDMGLLELSEKGKKAALALAENASAKSPSPASSPQMNTE